MEKITRGNADCGISRLQISVAIPYCQVGTSNDMNKSSIDFSANFRRIIVRKVSPLDCRAKESNARRVKPIETRVEGKNVRVVAERVCTRF